MPLAELTKRETREEGVITLRADVVPSTWDPKARTVEVVWTAGADVLRYDWGSGQSYWERLDFSEGAIRLERIQSGRCCVLDSHRQFGGLEAVLGVVVEGTCKIDSKKRTGTCLARFTEAQDVASLVQRIAEGVVGSFSFGYKRHRIEQTGEQRDGFPVWVVRDWEPVEISPVAIPADPKAGVRSEDHARGETHPCVFERGERMPEMTKPADQNELDQAARAAELERERQEAADKAATAEQQRGSEIRRLSKRAGLDDKFADELVGRSPRLSLDQARAAILDARAVEDDKAPTRGVHVGDADRTKFNRAVEDGLVLRTTGQAPKDAADGHRDFAGMRLLRIAAIVLGRAGVAADRLSDHELAKAAFGFGQARAWGGHGTSDFPQLLANVANKTLRQAYQEQQQSFEPLARRTTLSDFKAASRVQLGTFPSMAEVPENGEIPQGTFGDTAQGIRLRAYGRGWSVSWQALVNDDLDGFSRIPFMVAGAVRRLESDLFWAVITGNQVMDEDSTALFATTHASGSNLLSGAGTALAVAGLNGARDAMRTQKSPEGHTLNLEGKWLVVPSILEVTALQLVAPLVPAVSTNVNPFAGRLQGPVMEARLQAGGGAALTRWYLFADKSQIDTIELANLAGAEDVSLEWEPNFSVLGMAMRAYGARAAAAIDHRGMIRNEGA